jgi:2-dehydro-3-deoxyphosphogluconate aldolase/(4S)-4-hydroxy-2-oxoglutarate aldolase
MDGEVGKRNNSVNKTDILQKILSNGVFAVIRIDDPNKLFHVVEAVTLGGIKNIELTLTVPGAIELIKKLINKFPSDIIIGAGTVVNYSSAVDVIDAGAKFVVSPVFNLDVLNICHKHNVLYFPGCFTPTEIYTAWKAGAHIIKVFPATSLGPNYFKDLSGPFPNIKLMPTGGVTIDNVGEWVRAGAVAVGIGSDLLDKKAIAEERYQVLTDRAKKITSNFKKIKNEICFK